MPADIHCPQCSQHYQVAESALGQRVRCRQCGHTFTAAATSSPPVAGNPLDPLVGVSQWPALPGSPPPYGGANPLGMPAFSAPAWNQAAMPSGRPAVSNPSGGPTDGQMRLVCCGMLAMGLLLSVVSFFLEGATGTIYVAVLLLVPLTLVVGISGLVSPNVVRAMGKYGGHLPSHYKLIGWGLMGVAFLLMLVVSFGVFALGFRPERPGGAHQGVGLTRSQTAEVLERIRASHAASSTADVVRTVSFPVWSTMRDDGAAEAERVLGPAPGYVVGSFQLSPDRKKAAFQYRGDKEIAIQYALLLPGPTGIYLEFTPEFAE